MAAINRLIDSSLDRDDKNGVTKRTESLLVMRHPVVAWNAPGSFERERISSKKGGRTGRWKKIKEARHGEEKEESRKRREGEKKKERKVTLRCLNRP